MNTIGPDLQRQAECEAVLRSLPQWFGIEESLLEYAADSGMKPTFATENNAKISGFLTLREHFPESWEVHCLAVHADYRGKGQGSHLLAHAEDWLRRRGARFLQIKTIAAAKQNPYYAESRAFYSAKGYTPLEVFPALWHPSNPALQLVKYLGSNHCEIEPSLSRTDCGQAVWPIASSSAIVHRPTQRPRLRGPDLLDP